MNTAISNTFTRSLLAAGLAFAGTLVSFTATVTPAQAGVTHYSAKLATAVAAPKDKIIGDVVWKCVGDACSAPADGARPLNTCIKVAKSFGQLTSFTGPKGEFSVDDLQRCNAAA